MVEIAIVLASTLVFAFMLRLYVRTGIGRWWHRLTVVLASSGAVFVAIIGVAERGWAGLAAPVILVSVILFASRERWLSRGHHKAKLRAMTKGNPKLAGAFERNAVLRWVMRAGGTAKDDRDG